MSGLSTWRLGSPTASAGSQEGRRGAGLAFLCRLFWDILAILYHFMWNISPRCASSLLVFSMCLPFSRRLHYRGNADFRVTSPQLLQIVLMLTSDCLRVPVEYEYAWARLIPTKSTRIHLPSPGDSYGCMTLFLHFGPLELGNLFTYFNNNTFVFRSSLCGPNRKRLALCSHGLFFCLCL